MRRLLPFLFCLPTLSVSAQMWDRLATSNYQIDSCDVRVLKAEVDNLDFFRDNEYSSTLTKGYSLPGLWVEPKLTYVPLTQVKMELGMHALIFNGANKYPNYVYHDIGTWKGSQYQRGAHVLPWLRAQAQFRHMTIVLGNIYGGQNHGLIEPLFNTETNLSQDPEMGFQILWDRTHLHCDTWVNWQSYIFEEDCHQEAFTVGSTWKILYSLPDNPVQWYTPLQLVIQHRGGEQDTTDMGVQTICNASAGVGMKWHANRKVLHHVGAEANVLTTYQQSGHLWPFNSGVAYHATGEVNLWDKLNMRAGFLRTPNHFVSLYGSPFFTTISRRDRCNYNGLSTAYTRVDYAYTFSRNYVLGAEAEAYQCWLPGQNEFNFSFGLYFRVHPDFVLKKFCRR